MKQETRNFYQAAVRRSIEWITGHLDEALDLEDLARDAALSPFHFHRVFRGMVGETPLELHRRLALERSAWTLLHTDQRITMIAFDAGYETHESFTRAFRDRYGRSPSEFRRASAPGAADCAPPQRFELASKAGIHFVPLGGAPSMIHFIVGDRRMQADIREQPALRVATLRHRGPYNQIGEAFGRLGGIAGPAGLFRPGAVMIAIYHDDPDSVAAAELRSDAGVVVPDGAPMPAGLTEVQVPGGRYAVATHTGSYEGLGDAWSRLMGEWLPQSGERVRDSVSYEIYRNTPMDTPKEKLITEIYVPLG
ncbi:MAG: AraC family transcriptional regulator [Gemmatimonadaceae bacterium]